MRTTSLGELPVFLFLLLVACETPRPAETGEAGVTPQLLMSESETKEPTRLPETNAETPLKEMESDMSNLTIKTGTYFGECLGICADTLAITAEKMHFENFATPVDYRRPENVDERETKPSEWARIIEHVDVAAFRELPDQIGNPDASDMGGEFVEIAGGDFSKRVDFDFGASVSEIDDLLEALRQLRIEFSNKYR